MKRRRRARLLGRGAIVVAHGAAAAGLILLALGAEQCTPSSANATQASEGVSSLDGASAAQLDCVEVLEVPMFRGHYFANTRRFGEWDPALRETARLADLGLDDLVNFCNWEACVRTNGYNHACWIDDAGWERCRVCDGGEDCDGFPVSRTDCVHQSRDPGRAQCHVGLLQECLLQRGLRGFADPRTTQTCWLSQQSCEGKLPGDLTAQARAAQHETDQVTVEVCKKESDLTRALQPDSSVEWRELSEWDGGLPTDVSEDGAPLDVARDP